MSQGKLVGLIKQGFHEVPHLMLGGIVFTLAMCGNVFASRRHVKYERERKQWKRRYTVVREEEFDPNTQVHPVDHKYPAW